MLTDYCMEILDSPLTYIDAFSITAALLIFLFLLYISKRDKDKRK